MMQQRFCNICGFPLGRRPNLHEEKGVCGACINAKKKHNIDFYARQLWLTEYIAKNRNVDGYDAVIAVSGGKDSHMIVKRLMENHGIENPVLVTCLDEFTLSEAGKHNLKNISEYFDIDHIIYRYKPKTAKKQMLDDFENKLNPMIAFEERTVGESFPITIAKKFGIKLVFYGENAGFEYGDKGTETLEVFHRLSSETLSVIYMGAIYPYSISDSLSQAQSVGFKSLRDFGDWYRQGQADDYTQIDTYGYIISQWTKYVKYGAQRVADVACRLVREGTLTKAQALILTEENDHICDPRALRDFCQTLGITEKYFYEVVAKHANNEIVEKDCNGVWKRKDILK